MKERLSKLQKFVLKSCYNAPTGRRALIYGYFGEVTPSAEASLSRSLWLLFERKYISCLSPMRLSNMAIIYGMQRKSTEEFEKNYGHIKMSEKIAAPSIRGFNKIKIIMISDKGKAKYASLMLNNETI